jgi:hypothetical protein
MVSLLSPVLMWRLSETLLHTECGHYDTKLCPVIPVATHPVSYTVGTGLFLGVQRPGRVFDLHHLAPRLKKE